MSFFALKKGIHTCVKDYDIFKYLSISKSGKYFSGVKYFFLFEDSLEFKKLF